MNCDKSIAEVMKKDFISIPPNTCIEKAEKLMVKKGVDFLAIEEANEFLGIISKTDCEILRASMEKEEIYGPNVSLRLRRHQVNEIMHSKLVKLSTTDNVNVASSIMRSILFQIIPIMDKRKIVGVLTPKCIQVLEQQRVKIQNASLN